MDKGESIENWFVDGVEMIHLDEVEECRSEWGNSFSNITEEQIEELRNGNVIFIDDGEYCHFIALKKEN